MPTVDPLYPLCGRKSMYSELNSGYASKVKIQNAINSRDFWSGFGTTPATSVEIRLQFSFPMGRKFIVSPGPYPASTTGLLHLNVRISHSKEKSRNSSNCFCFFGPSVEIRTRGLLNPIQARYQTSPHPDIQLSLTDFDILAQLSKKIKPYFYFFEDFFSLYNFAVACWPILTLFVFPIRHSSRLSA